MDEDDAEGRTTHRQTGSGPLPGATADDGTGRYRSSHGRLRHLEPLVVVSDTYDPEPETRATLTVRWYTNDDFSIHYRETRPDGDWECQ